MLPKKFRLTVFQFNQNPQKSKESYSFFLHIKFKDKINNKYSRFVLLTPKKLDKRSTIRHLTKRIITETVYPLARKIKIPTDILIKALKIISKKDKKEIEKDICLLLKKAGLL